MSYLEGFDNENTSKYSSFGLANDNTDAIGTLKQAGMDVWDRLRSDLSESGKKLKDSLSESIHNAYSDIRNDVVKDYDHDHIMDHDNAADMPHPSSSNRTLLAPPTPSPGLRHPLTPLTPGRHPLTPLTPGRHPLTPLTPGRHPLVPVRSHHNYWLIFIIALIILFILLKIRRDM